MMEVAGSVANLTMSFAASNQLYYNKHQHIMEIHISYISYFNQAGTTHVELDQLRMAEIVTNTLAYITSNLASSTECRTKQW
ncbi:hypothetical protein WALSEDRAFT_60609 [Wallemia mellicola CBS 633.66]|uniref:Uncharacterized protein n=1 Tax=Wallemia mellicola (strain ATCC MYA-4683 / CBS 633.66) TaxID=671144 RepID=I4YB21_WALMC|nr:hypothetical protein WALSEDRAFT_60609 [Wallemia mellicola CBS 633.66]EIM21163.1 hypothetical protein WALSEDRAFT_60609 [Wallemia mellicola CBS 633.66]|eukprot:XP_006958836.1 hypothetical protein WALSEDRAFT_60609 [Wallemia mellicola CBS 633.66]